MATNSPSADPVKAAGGVDLEKVPVDQVLSSLTVDPAQGLPTAEASSRLTR